MKGWLLMEVQACISDIKCDARRKKTRREELLESMNAIISWDTFCSLIELYYFHNKTGRPAIGIEPMLRMYLLQVWFGLSDEWTEDSVLGSRAMRNCKGIKFLSQQAPDATTLMKFRHLLEQEGLQQRIAQEIQALLESKGLDYAWKNN